MIQKAYKQRFYPTAEQEILLPKIFGCVRFVWNNRVAGFNSWSPETTAIEESTIKELKTEYPWLEEVPWNKNFKTGEELSLSFQQET